MQIVFRKLSDDRHVLETTRGGEVRRVECETRSYLTHDLLHYAVETEGGLETGFWGSLAAGVDLTAGNEEVMQIERVVGALSSAVKGREAEALVAQLRLNADAFPMPAWLTVAFVVAVQARMRELLGRWRATPYGGAMELTWPE